MFYQRVLRRANKLGGGEGNQQETTKLLHHGGGGRRGKAQEAREPAD